MEIVKRGSWLVLGSALALLVACAGEDEPPTGVGSQPMVTAPTDHGDSELEEVRGTAPTIERLDISPREILPGRELHVVVKASDPDGDSIRFSFVWERNGREIARTQQPVVVLREIQKGDTITLIATATDGRNESVPMRIRRSVGNRPPVLVGLSLEPSHDLRAGMSVTATPEAQDPDNDRLTYRYRWTVNGSVRGEARVFETDGLRRGDKISLEVRADDGDLQSQPYSLQTELGNTPPTIASDGERSEAGGAYLHQFTAKDADGDRNLRFYLEQGPAGMSMDGITGLLRWEPGSSQGGHHQVVVGVRDASGDGSTFGFAVDVELGTEQASPAAPAP